MNIWVILPSLALISGVLASVYFFVEWIRHKRLIRCRFLLLWASGLFLMYWFQIPAIFANAGLQVLLERFNFFFSLMFPVTLAALFLYFIGILESTGFRFGQKHLFGFGTFLSSAVVFFGYFFIAHRGVIQTYTLVIGGLLLFYVPMYVLIITALVRRSFSFAYRNPSLFVWGAGSIIFASLLGVIRSGIVLSNVIAYPPEFWHVAMNSSKTFFVLQIMGTLLFALGFFWLYRSHRIIEASEEQVVDGG